ncbi:MAG: hypothetical protein ACM3WU_09030 [Bacillota bacterium]
MSPQVPRVAAVVFILFVSLFAIDAFDGDAPGSLREKPQAFRR